MMFDYLTFVLQRLTKVHNTKAFCAPREHPKWTSAILAQYLKVSTPSDPKP